MGVRQKTSKADQQWEVFRDPFGGRGKRLKKKKKGEVIRDEKRLQQKLEKGKGGEKGEELVFRIKLN